MSDSKSAQYTFWPAEQQDLPLLWEWLQAPEVVRWWGDPVEQIALLREDLTNDDMVMRIVSHRGRPFAYAQDYEVHAWPQAHFAHLPQGARAIDAFIGDAEMVGKGHGSIFLRLLAGLLKANGAPVVTIDPGVDNKRARRAYEKAGFRAQQVVETGCGPAILMTI